MAKEDLGQDKDAAVVLTDVFQQVLASLNTVQRQAVETIEGPVMVVAGPGTGKTQLLAARVGQILANTDTAPASILCLTFTDAGVKAMRERLIRFIGADAYKVAIYTFHSFCNSVIQDNQLLFGRHGLEPLSELERVELIQELLLNLPVAHPLRAGSSDPFARQTQVAALFAQMKAENWTAAYVQEQIDAYINSLPAHPDFVYQVNRKPHKKGDLKQARYEQELERMERLEAAAALFPLYQQQLQQRKRYEFADMILWVKAAFERFPNLLRNYQERYLYFLVDEFQDTNGAQYAILQHLISYWEDPNVLVVGDDDQSIYEFQGARLKNILHFYDQYRHSIALFVLSENYRSVQPILDAARQLIDQNDLRLNAVLALEKKLQSKVKHKGLKPGIWEHPNRVQEDSQLATFIQQKVTEGTPAGEIAVLYAKHQQGERLAALLRRLGIPISIRKKTNALDHPLVQRLLTLLEYFHKHRLQPYSAEHLLADMLFWPFAGFQASDTAQLLFFLHKEQPATDENQPVFLTRALSQESWLKDAGITHVIPYTTWGTYLNHCIEQYSLLSLPRWLEVVLQGSGVLQVASKEAEGMAALFSFIEWAQAESVRKDAYSLEQLLRQVQQLRSNGISLPTQDFMENPQAVQLLTAHSSKGLEFDHVILLGCTQDQWGVGTGQQHYQFALPDTLTLSGEEDALEARRRLFYVAATRARQSLTLSYAVQKEDGRQLQPVQFIDELRSECDIVDNRTPSQQIQVHMLQLLQPPAVSIEPLLSEHLVKEKLRHFRMSVSSLNQYLDCPLGFYYMYIVGVPIAKSESAAYGLAIHYALQRLVEARRLDKNKQVPTVQALVQFFEQDMQRRRSQFTAATFMGRLENGKNNLRAYYERNKNNWPEDVKSEYHIRTVTIDEVPITGIIDKIAWLNHPYVQIEDYKTGRPDPKKAKRPDEDDPLGGSYWRQLVFYKILFELLDKEGKLVSEAILSFIDPDKTGKYHTIRVGQDEMDIPLLRRVIRETYDHILQQDFYTGCGKPTCFWCRFTERQWQTSGWENAALADLDDEV